MEAVSRKWQVSMGIVTGEMVVSHVPGGMRIDRADDEIRVSLQLLADAREPWLTVRGNTLTFEGLNGTQVYNVSGWDVHCCALVCQRVIELSDAVGGV